MTFRSAAAAVVAAGLLAGCTIVQTPPRYAYYPTPCPPGAPVPQAAPAPAPDGSAPAAAPPGSCVTAVQMPTYDYPAPYYYPYYYGPPAVGITFGGRYHRRWW